MTIGVPLLGALTSFVAVGAALLAPQVRGPAPPLALPHPDARVLEAAGWSRPLWQWEAARTAVVLVAIVLALVAGAPPPIAVGAGLLPSIGARMRAETALRRARAGTTRILRSAEATLGSGGGLPEALRRGVAATGDPTARRPFVSALHAFDLGASLDVALRDAAMRCGDPRVRRGLETLAIGVSSRLGADRISVLLGAVTDRFAFDERLAEEVRARTAGLRFQVIVLAALVPVMAIYLAMTVPALATTLSSPLGRFVLIPAAAVLELVGVVASRAALDGIGR